MIKVKVCGLTDPGNVRDVADAGADFLGYIFYRGSKRYVGDNPVADLFAHIPEYAKKVGVFVNEEQHRVIEAVKQFGLSMVQLHGEENAIYCKAIRDNGTQVIKAFGIRPDFDFSNLLPYMEACDFFMFDAKTELYGGSGLKFGWEVLRDYDLNKPFFLSGGIGPGDTLKIKELKHRALFAADINSRFEFQPGVKDIIKVRTFIYHIKTSET